MRFTRDEVDAALRVVREVVPPTPQFAWPLLAQRVGATVWVKHENHTPAGAFKVRGGLTYFEQLVRGTRPRGVITATRGNHGQSIGFAARKHGLPATIVVPHGNSVEKNAAMRALGVELLEHGDDFQSSREHAMSLAKQQGLHMVPSFHRDLIRGVMTYWVEFFDSFARGQEPDVVFVPIGQGSGFCAAAAARAHCGVKSRLVGVVSAHATTYLESFRARHVVESPVTTELADGMACRLADQEALDVLLREADDLVAVTDDEVASAMRALFADTHNVAEGAGAAALAAALQQRDRWRGRGIGVPLTGGNVDTAVFASVLAGEPPGVAAATGPLVATRQNGRMGTLYMVRHGQASFGADDYDNLSELGRRQSVRLGEWFAHKGIRFDALIAGTLRRHKQTLEGILEGMNHAGEHLSWEGLNEYDSGAVIATVHPGPLEKPTTPEIYRHHFRLLRDGLSKWMAGDAQPEGMPSYSQFVAGVSGALDHVRLNHYGQDVLMVTSGGPISTAVGHVLGTSPEATIELNLRIRNTSVTEFAFNPKRTMLVMYNAIPHLDDPRFAGWVTYA